MKFVYIFIFLFSSILTSQINYIDSHGMKQGEWKLYFPYLDSVVSEQGSFTNNLEEGVWIKYHDNGKVREISYYKAGKLDGYRLSISKKGQLNDQEFFLNGQYHGSQIYYYDNSKKKMECHYIQGAKHGNFLNIILMEIFKNL